MSTTEKPRIQFHFQPYKYDDRMHVVEKSQEGERPHRYLLGIASGPQIDGHGERISTKAIESFHRQANSGDVLLYADKHGVAYTDDIGILTKSEILPDGDWFAEFRLYDEGDNVGPQTLERADKLWKQINGFPPYKTPKQKGFSIEGYIPDNGIASMAQDGRRVIDDVELDGCVVVPRPAYRTSIAHALYKALGEPAPWIIQKGIRETLQAQVATDAHTGSYYRQVYALQNALEDNIEKIMADPTTLEKKSCLVALFDEYRDMMIELIMRNHQSTEMPASPSSSVLDEVMGLYQTNAKVEIIKSMLSTLDSIQKKLEG